MENKLKNHIEKRIDFYMDLLKDELKKRVVFVFNDKDMEKIGDQITQASINTAFNPALITFYIKTLVGRVEMGIDNYIKELIRHEIAHLFVGKNEKTASSKEKSFKIFKNGE